VHCAGAGGKGGGEGMVTARGKMVTVWDRLVTISRGVGTGENRVSLSRDGMVTGRTRWVL
jgi:hypothetical protein